MNNVSLIGRLTKGPDLRYTSSGIEVAIFSLAVQRSFRNKEVELIEPEPKKYYLRLYKNDNFSYINKNVYFSYEVANKSVHTNYKTKFTQEEIDESMLLKFIEQHGIKEEVEDNEID